MIFSCKQYALELKSRKTGQISHAIKLRGFCLDSATSETFNYEAFKRVVLENYVSRGIVEPPYLEAKYQQLYSSIHRCNVVTKSIKKKYAPVFQKGFLNAACRNQFLPFGYCPDA